MNVCFDTETTLIEQREYVPKLVCMTWAFDDQSGIYHHMEDACEVFLRECLEKNVLYGHNVAFDMAVIGERYPHLKPLIFKAYNEDRVTDTKLRQQLLDIAGGCYRGRPGSDNKWVTYNYALDDLARRFLKKKLDKDTWRLRYGELIDTPLSEWPEGAKQYPIEDAVTTQQIFELQELHADFLKDQFRQARAAFALHLSSAHGIRTDDAKVRAFLAGVEQEREETKEYLVSVGLVRKDGSRDTKAAMSAIVNAFAEINKEPILTDTGRPSLAKEVCDLVDHDPMIHAYSEYQTLSKILSNDGPMLLSGTQLPIHTNYGLAETGRTTSSKPNIQNLRRKVGIREAFVPRPGKVFAQADYEGLELCTLAQCCLELVGHSKLAEAINAGLDAHMELGAVILGISPEEAKRRGKKDPEVGNARQSAKIANFGFPVGMGPDALVHFAKKTYDTTISKETAVMLKQRWLMRWPEMVEYFQHVNRLCANPENLAFVEQLFVKRYRGGTPYTKACSTYSQGLGGDAAKEAFWRITEACYNQPDHILFGSRVAAFIHDEYLLEVDDDERAHDKAMALQDLMVKGAKKYIKDVDVKAPPLLMRFWSKNAEAVYDSNGRLTPWSENVQH